jgi:RNA polymerase sigma factor (sigma-70 family)
MLKGKKPPTQNRTGSSPAEIIDLLATPPSVVPFATRIETLALSEDLKKKILAQDIGLGGAKYCLQKDAMLTANDEKELATEVLKYRHIFTEQLLCFPKFRQATLTIIQNIYLFKNRKIFFGTMTPSAESERQEALLLFSSSPPPTSLPLANTFQHLMIARIWNRIISHSTEGDFLEFHFMSLLDTVEKLNTLRNIYVLLTTCLVKKFAARTNRLYKQSITYEDATQIGAIGIARAAYRYHPSSGVRFSTFAAHWVQREIQRQALGGRLVRVSTNIVEGYAKAAKGGDSVKTEKFSNILQSAISVESGLCEEQSTLSESGSPSYTPSPAAAIESAQLRKILLETINKVLSLKTGDIIKRRFGLPPYMGDEQSILTISKVYKVTRSSIYQQEQAALRKLHYNLQGQFL